MESPADYHWKYILGNRKEPTKAMEEGTLIHMLALEPQEFEKQVLVMPVFTGRTQKGELTTNPNATEVKMAKANWIMEACRTAGVTEDEMYFVTEEDFKKFCMMRDNIHKHDVLKEIFAQGAGANEVAAWFVHEELGVLFVMRVDRLTNKALISDVKTTNDASFNAFQRAVVNGNLHIQAAINVDGFSKILGVELNAFDWSVVQTTEPYGVVHYPLDFGSLEAARAEYLFEVRRWLKCHEENHWPFHQDQPMALPKWKFDQINAKIEGELFNV